MTASTSFFNVNVALFSTSIQYLVLGVYNLIRLNLKGTAIDYFVLQSEIIFVGTVYVFSIIFLFSDTDAKRKTDTGYRAIDKQDDEDDENSHVQRLLGVIPNSTIQPDDGDKDTVLGPRVQGMFDIIMTCKIACGVVLSLLAQSLLSCYIGNNNTMCAKTWRGDYRVGFAVFYILMTLCLCHS